jgi:hypothetical protein
LSAGPGGPYLPAAGRCGAFARLNNTLISRRSESEGRHLLEPCALRLRSGQATARGDQPSINPRPLQRRHSYPKTCIWQSWPTTITRRCDPLPLPSRWRTCKPCIVRKGISVPHRAGLRLHTTCCSLTTPAAARLTLGRDALAANAQITRVTSLFAGLCQ